MNLTLGMVGICLIGLSMFALGLIFINPEDEDDTFNTFKDNE